MSSLIQRAQGTLERWLRAPVSKTVPGAVIWLFLCFFLFWVLRFISGGWGSLFFVLQILTALSLIAVALPLLWRFIHLRLLWSLNSRLVLTYLLFGLAPIVLFATLVFFASYLAAGQFAIHLADSRVQDELAEMSTANAHRISQMIVAMQSRDEAQTHGAPVNARALFPEGEDPVTDALAPILIDSPHYHLHRHTSIFLDGAPLLFTESGESQSKAPLGLPPWATKLPDGRFSGLVLDGGTLFLVALDQHVVDMGPNHRDHRRLTLEDSVLVDRPLLSSISNGLGRVGLTPMKTGESPRSIVPRSVVSGSLPSSANLIDIQVRFPSTLSVFDWGSKQSIDAPIEVFTRPSLLSHQLFGGSVGRIYTDVYLILLAALVLLFAFIEIVALYLALRVSHSITSSVTELYAATQRIDRGDLGHRIRVRGADQLSELARSFNGMTGSLQRLLQEQQEKERLQNELSIAQEVQANLFPRADCDLANLQLHGVCRPARSVSGDYYDFLVFHKESGNGHPSHNETGVGIALGDISGKGISAALLMATLHSAVRAYRFATEELIYSETSLAGLTSSRSGNTATASEGCGELFQSPGRILSLLNRHLYRSTQPEKYATLFLAHYDAESNWLTYSNAGQLPPLVLSRDGSIRRLDKGGTVVGLIDGMHYEEDGFRMAPGDILVAYSDGVTEPENDFGDFGEDRLMEVVERYRDEPLHVISAQVMLALDAWIGGEEQPDDITLVLARQL
ncbi:MAG TPA: PP2C family protein-serine/threonine phosphatase [Granulicella sp.]|nr:PP2C family protein-serine/threonine phosphatase [Granulicella sp.]